MITTSSTVKVLRLIPPDPDTLDRKVGNRGEIFYDRILNTIRIYDGINAGGIDLVKSDLSNVSDADFLVKAQAAGLESGSGNTTVTVSDTEPEEATSGNLWLNTTNGRLYVYYTDENSSQWIQPASPLPDISGFATEEYVNGALEDFATEEYVNAALEDFATEEYVNTAINNIPPADLSSYATLSDVLTQVSSIPEYDFSIAGDDSVTRKITSGNTVQFIGAGGISITTDSNSVVTITGTSSSDIGNLSVSEYTINSLDSNAIIFVPEVEFQSEITVNDLVLQGEFSSQGSGVPELSSDNEILLTAGTRVEITASPLKMAAFTSTERDNLIAENGDVIYNTTTNKFQGYANGIWVDLH